MREIKFRAWDKRMNVMIEEYPIPGNYISINNLIGYFSDRYIPLQYTGLKDKNGKEIYEGDIVIYEYEKKPATIKFGKGYQGEPADGMYPYWGWYVDGWLDHYAFAGDEIEVIGNIYENPELLEKQ